MFQDGDVFDAEVAGRKRVGHHRKSNSKALKRGVTYGSHFTHVGVKQRLVGGFSQCSLTY